jgi:hypothetical protein
MNPLKIIKVFYIIYTFYIFLVINSTDITVYTMLPTILILWINYFIFSAGYRVSSQGKDQGDVSASSSSSLSGWLLNLNKISLLFFGLLSLLFSIFAVNYYTGQTPMNIFTNFANGVSLYYEYQSHFKEQQLHAFSLTKIPFIFMLFYIKFFLFYSYISFFIVKKHTTKIEKLYLFLITISFIYVGIGRGTNYEFFELVMLIIFIVLTRQVSRFPIKSFSVISILIGIMIIVFYNTVKARGVIFDYYISQDINYDPDGFLPYISPQITLITVILFGYFGFGFFYVSKYVSEIWFSSIGNFFAGLFPMGYQIVGQDNVPTTMQNIIDIGVMWHPDVALLINDLGYIGLLIYCFLIGFITKHISNNKRKNPILYLTSFMVLMQMISLPVGNFVFTSSASKLIVISLVMYWIWKLIIKVKIKL